MSVAFTLYISFSAAVYFCYKRRDINIYRELNVLYLVRFALTHPNSSSRLLYVNACLLSGCESQVFYIRDEDMTAEDSSSRALNDIVIVSLFCSPFVHWSPQVCLILFSLCIYSSSASLVHCELLNVMVVCLPVILFFVRVGFWFIVCFILHIDPRFPQLLHNVTVFH